MSGNKKKSTSNKVGVYNKNNKSEKSNPDVKPDIKAEATINHSGRMIGNLTISKDKKSNKTDGSSVSENDIQSDNTPVSEIGIQSDDFPVSENNTKSDKSIVSENSTQSYSIPISDNGIQLDKNSVSKNDAPSDNSSVRDYNTQSDMNSEDDLASEKNCANKAAADDAFRSLKKKRWDIRKILRIICIAGFFIFLFLFINEVFIQPYLTDKSNQKAKQLFNNILPTEAPENVIVTSVSPSAITEAKAEPEKLLTPMPSPAPTPDPTRDSKGRLIAFKDLLVKNEDVKGWITLTNINGKNDTKIDYVVMQSSNGDPLYYLTRDWQGNNLKSGSLFLDYKSSVEKNTKNLVIHGHNMTSTDDMFHYLLKYKKMYFYQEHPVIKFDTIYQTGYWKVFSVFLTNGTSVTEPLFDYTISEFKDNKEFLDFVYKLRVRSLYNIDTVDINENDQLLTLSTCTYEVKNYRLVIVARKVREGEDLTVDTESVTENSEPLYPHSYYYDYGGKAPKIPETYNEALAEGKITWYKPAGNKEDFVPSK